MAPPFTPTLNPILNPNVVGGQEGPAFAASPQGCTGLQVIDVTLTSAQILLLQTTPVTIVPSPGVTGWFTKPEKIVLRYIGGTVAYTDAGGAVSFLVGANMAAALASNAIFLVTVAPNRRIQVLDFYASAAGAGITGVAANPPTEDNAAMTISKATNQFAAGNGTMHITVYYTTETSI